MKLLSPMKSTLCAVATSALFATQVAFAQTAIDKEVVLSKPVESEAKPVLPIVTEKISFAKNDYTAINIVRNMYGKDFKFIRVVRTLLENPSEDPEQLFIKLGRDRDCKLECLNVVLFYNTQWLEIYRRPHADSLGLTEVGPFGMKSIIADRRRFDWNSKFYYPLPKFGGLVERKATEAELKEVNRQLGVDVDTISGKGFAPPIVAVYDVTLRDGNERIVSVISPYFCGQKECPVFILNSDGKSIRRLDSLDGGIGVSDKRDSSGWRGVEIATTRGVTAISPTDGTVMETIPFQEVQKAGWVR